MRGGGKPKNKGGRSKSGGQKRKTGDEGNLDHDSLEIICEEDDENTVMETEN